MEFILHNMLTFIVFAQAQQYPIWVDILGDALITMQPLWNLPTVCLSSQEIMGGELLYMW